jgi:hypothetical protein
VKREKARMSPDDGELEEKLLVWIHGFQHTYVNVEISKDGNSCDQRAWEQ